MKTPAEAIQSQHAVILEAIALLQADLDKMTAEISPDTDSWKDVAQFAHIADRARVVVDDYNAK